MNLEDVLKGIAHHRDRIHTDNLWTDPDELSDVGLKLMTYNTYLAEQIADAHKMATDKQHSIYLECLAKGEGVTKAEQMAKGESTELRRNYEHIKFVYTATGDLIRYIQSKLRVIDNQMRQER